jgi:hypothetical protein
MSTLSVERFNAIAQAIETLDAVADVLDVEHISARAAELREVSNDLAAAFPEVAAPAVPRPTTTTPEPSIGALLDRLEEARWAWAAASLNRDATKERHACAAARAAVEALFKDEARLASTYQALYRKTLERGLDKTNTITELRASLTQVAGERDAARVEASKYEEAEAACCPEDVGFVEYIGVLERRVAALTEAAQKVVDESGYIGGRKCVVPSLTVQRLSALVTPLVSPQEGAQ